MRPIKEKLIGPLKTLLSYEPEDAILDYVISIQTEDDLRDFIQNILDVEDPTHLLAHETIHNILFRENSEPITETKSEEKPKQTQTRKNKPFKNKKKFKDIDTYQQKEKTKEGRVACNCQGQKHDFMNNCLNCGRIHCIEEGPGPCLFCENYLEATGRNEIAPDFQPRENKIFDDDNDYFKMGQEGCSRNKKPMVFALDLATRTVIESTEEDEKIRKRILEDCMKHLKNVDELYKKLERKSSEVKPKANIYDEMVNLLVSMRHMKVSGVEPDLSKEDGKMPDSTFLNKRIIDDSDQGLCLSMHQPYASLLIAGVKRHEGRNWPTNYRGILWIAAAAQKPDLDDITAVEEFYRAYYNEPNLKFPRNYPTSCLLGCVELEDCLSQDVYRKQYPDGESNSPYVLICKNPIILPLFYPIVGQHKIYSMDRDLHESAKLCLRYANLIA